MPRPALLRRAIFLAMLAAVSASAAMGVAAWLRARAAQKDARAGQGLYAVSFDDADGHAQSLAQWRGKWLVVNFWATWCAPCVAELPDLEKMQQEFAGRNVAVLGIGIEDRERVRQFRDRLGLHMTLLAGGYDALGLARTLGDSQGELPYTALLSVDGQLLQTQTGALRPGQLRNWLSRVP